MTDFEQEIEARLDLFQHLTGKGNVKDSNRTLYEIVRLMLGMINHRSKVPEPPPPPASEPPQTAQTTIPDAPPVETAKPAVEPAVADALHTSDTPDTTMLPTDQHVIHQPPLHSEVQHHAPNEKSRNQNAPHGYTASGNVRRIRNRKKVK